MVLLFGVSWEGTVTRSEYIFVCDYRAGSLRYGGWRWEESRIRVKDTKTATTNNPNTLILKPMPWSRIYTSIDLITLPPLTLLKNGQTEFYISSKFNTRACSHWVRVGVLAHKAWYKALRETLTRPPRPRLAMVGAMFCCHLAWAFLVALCTLTLPYGSCEFIENLSLTAPFHDFDAKWV